MKRIFYILFFLTSIAHSQFSQSVYDSKSNPTYPGTELLASTAGAGYNASDATDAFYAAIESANDFVVINNVGGSPTVWNIDPKRTFNSVNNKTIVFEDGVTLTNIGVPATVATSLFDLGDSNDVHVYGYGARLELKRAGLTAEAQHSVHFRGTTNCSLRGFEIVAIGNSTDAGGDGFKTGSSPTQDNCIGTVVEDLKIENQSRLGIASTADINSIYRNIWIRATNGRWPSGPWDFEGDHSDHRLENILVENVTAEDSDGNGIVFGLFFMNSDPGSSGNTETTGFVNDISITLNNILLRNNMQDLTKTTHGANNDRFPPAEIKFGRTNHKPVSGFITFNNLVIEASENSAIAVVQETGVGAMRVAINNSTFNLSGTHVEPILIKDGSFLPRAIGGLDFSNVTLNTTNVTSLYKIEVGGSTYADSYEGNMFHSGPTTNDAAYSGSASQGLTQDLNIVFGTAPNPGNDDQDEINSMNLLINH